MQVLSINHLDTAYVTGGIGDRHLLFIHGWAASGKMWLRSMWPLRHDYRMWALDLPGFGDSQTPNGGWLTIESYTDHVAAFCEHLDIHPYAIVGHSMGGRITLDLAHRYPHLAERLIVVAPSVTGRLGFNLDLFMAGDFGRLVFNLSRHVWPIATAGALSTYWTPRYLGSEAVKRTTDDLRRSSWEGAISSLLALSNHDYTHYLPEINQPTLIVCGEKDYTIPTDDSRLAAQTLPNARLVMLDHIHHWPTDEDLPAFIRTIQPFLNHHQLAGLQT